MFPKLLFKQTLYDFVLDRGLYVLLSNLNILQLLYQLFNASGCCFIVLCKGLTNEFKLKFSSLHLKDQRRRKAGCKSTDRFKSLISGFDRLVGACLERRVINHLK